MPESPRSNRAELLHSFKTSGQTQQSWCQTHGINIHTLRYWLSKDRQAAGNASSHEQAQWLTVQVQTESPALHPQALHIQIGSFSVAVHPGFDPQHLLGVLRTLSAL